MSADVGNQLTDRPNAVAADDTAEHQRAVAHCACKTLLMMMMMMMMCRSGWLMVRAVYT